GSERFGRPHEPGRAHFRTDQVPLDRIASQQTVERLRLNTLNPEREAQIAAETDRARIDANRQVALASVGRSGNAGPVPSNAPQAPPGAAPAPTGQTPQKSQQ